MASSTEALKWTRRVGYIMMLILALLDDVTGHGGLVDPPMRSIMWREGFDAPVNYDWNALYCGGFNKFKESGGKCGLCGDPYDGPFDNDKGGVYDTGIIVRHYPVSLREIEVKVEITAHHKGYFAFKLCPNNEQPLTKACLDRYPLVIREARQQGDPYRYRPPATPNLHEVHVLLPPEVTCDRCVLQWTYTAGNSAGRDSSGRSCIGCGLQETFVNCADISIGGTMDHVPVTNLTGVPVEEVVIPQRLDIMDLIRSASPDTPIRDILAMFRGSLATPPSKKPQIQMQEARQPIPATRPVPRKRITEAPTPNRRPVPRKRTTEAPTPTRRRVVPLQSNRIGNPTATEHNRMEIDRRRKTLSRSGATSAKRPRTNPRSSRVPDSRGRGRMPLSPLRSGTRDSSLLDTMGRTLDELHGHGLPPFAREPFRRSNRRRPPRRRTTSRPDARFVHTGLNIFGDPAFDRRPSVAAVAERVPHGTQWRRGDGMTSHRAAVRHASTFGRINMPPEVLRRHVPDLPLDILPRQDLDLMQRRRSSSFRENWFPESRRPRERIRSPAKSRVARDRIPRRIVVHSMTIAQDLLRKYPQLKGRVYLSPEAHARNVLAHMSHKYRRRQRWH